MAFHEKRAIPALTSVINGVSAGKSRLVKMTYVRKHLSYALLNITYANCSLFTVKQSVPVM